MKTLLSTSAVRTLGWAEGVPYAWSFSQDAIADGAKDTLALSPAG